MKLSELIENIHVRHVAGTLETEVTGVHHDSRSVRPGGVFCALKGVGRDGHDFIQAAIENGAVAVLSERPNPAAFLATWIQVGNGRAAMATAAANFEGHPSLRFPVVGVTGTNGKTTTAFLVHHLMKSILHRAGLLGTIYYSTGEALVEASHTTPESTEVQRLLREMAEADCRGMAMEVSSHGLDQRRVTGVAFDVGIFTNLTQDHLDYHLTMENYFSAKRLLFEQMDSETTKKGTAVINLDDPYGERLAKTRFERLRVVTYGRGPNADFRIGDLRSDFNGTQYQLRFQGRQFLVRIPLIGSFNVYNSVAAIGAAWAIGLNLREVVAKMADAPQVPGRLELVGGRQTNYRVFVDYAHTPDALTNVLSTLRALEPNRIITVFGCGGDRDSKKRPLMAAAAEAGSDLCILTSDNPRGEDPGKILSDAARGFSRGGHEVREDRRAAIGRAIELAGQRDIVLIAGKGHESYQEIKGVRHDFDDRKVAAGFIHRKAEGSET
ncbi:MAG: UDP-N-acetylmuramoyl-L-alanyl-D-glutamate--2,6-diaminopimelate ligase [Verrucomicrobia bacterium]|nr:UDP-N-acetylmuramoyl-L-alanyl-D-glutamate--2,6-diaminopimelate ligase [Verrucomicrobiota bacterium]